MTAAAADLPPHCPSREQPAEGDRQYAREMAAPLDGDDLRYAHGIVTQIRRDFVLAGQPVPQRIQRLYDHLGEAVRMSARGRDDCATSAQSRTLSGTEVAREIGRNAKWVYRHRTELGGFEVGDRWRYPRATVLRWKREKNIG